MQRMIGILTIACVSLSAAHPEGPGLVAPVVGEKAPRLKIATTFKGKKTEDFQRGTVYVVEFWATWCKPCLVQLPHVRELQRTYPKVEFVWLDVWEGDEPGVRHFVERMGDQMPFTVVMDADRDADGIGATARSWLPSTGIKGIPASVIIDAEGRVAWMGPPEKLDAPLKAVMDGSWDLEAAAKISRLRQELLKTFEEYDARFRSALDDGQEATKGVLDEYIRVLQAQRNALEAKASAKP